MRERVYKAGFSIDEDRKDDQKPFPRSFMQMLVQCKKIVTQNVMLRNNTMYRI